MEALDGQSASTPEAALLRLMTWLSPNYPIGAFSYSHGLEFAAEEHPLEPCVKIHYITGF